MIRREIAGPDAAFERSGAELYRGTRHPLVGLGHFLKGPASGVLLALAAIGVVVEPGLVDLLTPVSILYASWVLTRRVVLPLRLPKTARSRDPNYPDPKNRQPRMAAGIIYLGRDHRTGQELWVTNEDGRQHVVLPGTTGAGKTRALLSLVSNALIHGSGFTFVDGKGSNGLYANVLGLARKFGREDDVLVLNFLVAAGHKDSNTFNPFAYCNADVLRELLISQIESNPGGKGNNEVFMQRAGSLLGALAPVLVWMRDHRAVPIDIEKIRFATELQSVVALALDKRFRRLHVDTGAVEEIPVPDIPEALLYPLRAYLGETGGYDPSLPYNKQKSDEPAKQHSFVTMHFSSTFTQLAVSLGHIFKCEFGDIEPRDVFLNRRILVVILPALENSGETTAALGKLVVASLRNMMAQILPAKLEGAYVDIVANGAASATTPYPIVFDELVYYVAPGMDKMLAMGRELGLMFYIAFQEAAGLKARIGDAMYSLLGNANLQILMKLKDGGETRRYVEQSAGDTHVTQAIGYTANDSGHYRASDHAEIRRVARVEWTDLLGLIEGEAIILFGNRRIYARLFHAETDTPEALRLNRPIAVRPPAAELVVRHAQKIDEIRAALEIGVAMGPDEEPVTPTLQALLSEFEKKIVAGDDVAAAAAIAAVGNVQDKIWATKSAAMAEQGQDASDTEFAAMLQGPHPVDGMDLAASQVDVTDRQALGDLSAIEEFGGRPTPTARTLATSLLAERDGTLEDLDARTSMPLEELRTIIEALIDELEVVAAP